MELLTQKQQKILDLIEQKLAVGAPPSQKEIAHLLGLTQNAVFQLIRYLKRKGYIEDSSLHRNLRLSEQYLAYKQQTKGFPVVGRVAAGEPILAQQNITDYMDIESFFKKQSKAPFLLKVVGDSMVDEGIMDGDYVIVKPQATIENSQIGVVILDDEATVKRIFINGERMALKPANKKYKMKYFRRGEKNIRIAGKVIGCFRAM
jgi:repressor LexA